MSDKNVPLALPDWLDPSEVSRIVAQVGVATHRGETVDARTNIRRVSEK